MALTKISTGGVKDDAASQAKIADEAVDEARLQISNAGTNGQFLQKTSNTGGLTWADAASEGTEIKSTGESGTSKFLRVDGDGTSSWQVPPDTVYTHPNHSGEVTSSADGAQTIASNVVDEDNLKISNAGTNGQYLQKQSGNTGGLTWSDVTIPPAGTTIDLVADGAIANNKAVFIKSNGKAAEIKQTYTNRSTPHDASGMGTFQTSSECRFNSAAYDAGRNRILVHYNKSQHPSKLNVIAGTPSTGSVSWGTALEHYTTGNINGMSVCSLGDNTGKFLCCWNDSADYKACVVTVNSSDNSCTAGSAITFDSDNGGSGTLSHNSLSYDPNTGRAVAVYRKAYDNSNWHRGYATVFSVSGTTVSSGTPVIIENDWNNNGYASCYDDHTDRLVITYYKMGTYDGHIRLATISTSSNTLTIHGRSSAYSGTANDPCVASNNKGQCAVGYQNDDGSYSNGRVSAVLFTINSSNNTVSFGSYGHFSSDYKSRNMTTNIVHEPSSDTFVMAWSRNNSSNYSLIVNFRPYSGTTWGTAATEKVLTSTSNYAHLVQDRTDTASCTVIADKDNKGVSYRVSMATGASNCSDVAQYIGFADQAYSDGQTATIKTYGNNVSTLSGLTAGTKYFIQSNGTVGTSADSVLGSGKAGVALSSTKLLITDAG